MVKHIQRTTDFKHRQEGGQGLTEYMILLVLIALVSIGAAKTLGTTIKEKIQTARRHIHSDINFDQVR